MAFFSPQVGEFLGRRQLRSSVREVDQVFRYGGEEFLIVLPGRQGRGSPGGGGEAPGRTGGAVIRSTLSGGAAEFGRHSLDVAALVAAADRALYRVKEAGRDGVAAA